VVAPQSISAKVLIGLLLGKERRTEIKKCKGEFKYELEEKTKAGADFTSGV
jgi:hypothetical protein